MEFRAFLSNFFFNINIYFRHFKAYYNSYNKSTENLYFPKNQFKDIDPSLYFLIRNML